MFFLNKDVSEEFIKDVEWIKEVYFKLDNDSKKMIDAETIFDLN